jgi:3-deoxy-7-phosphoheptulonate synthase
LVAGEPGVVGVMLESFLVPGRQDVELGTTGRLTYGQSITDACMGWETTTEVLGRLAGAVRSRRRAAGTHGSTAGRPTPD